MTSSSVPLIPKTYIYSAKVWNLQLYRRLWTNTELVCLLVSSLCIGHEFVDRFFTVVAVRKSTKKSQTQTTGMWIIPVYELFVHGSFSIFS